MSRFQVSEGGEAGDLRWSAWGRFAAGGFKGEEDGVTLEGELTTGFLGADVDGGRWLGGAALAVSEGEGPFTLESDLPSTRSRGRVESRLTSVFPYARLSATEGLDLWAMGGLGRGTMTIDEEGAAPIETDIGMAMGAVGAKGTVLEPGEEGGLALSVKSDALWVQMESDAVDAEAGRLAASQADVSRLRLVLEGSRDLTVGEDGTLTPSVEVGVRHDAGDAETGTGIEVGAGLRYAAGPLTIEGRVRTLVAHEASDYEEWGASGEIRVTPGDSGRGLRCTSLRCGGMGRAGSKACGPPRTRACSDSIRAPRRQEG